MIDIETVKKLHSGEFVGPIIVMTDATFWAIGKQGFSRWEGAYGKARIIKTEKLIGFQPERSTNWVLEFAGGVIIFGCQIHYLQFVDKSVDNQSFDKTRLWEKP